ncbi:MAG: IPT/TIG domain-containing protein [Anaerolineae bacterium]|nr:IPT/TIG domain-containing protein [Anaerolineae bacterium]
MRRYPVVVLMLGLAVLLSAPLTARAQDTAPEAPTVTDPVAAPAVMAVDVMSIEPTALVATVGGTLSVYGTGFTSESVVRLQGFGLLNTTFVNATALKAEVPATVPAGVYSVEVSDGAGVPDVLVQALTMIAPTPTPRPTAAPSAPPAVTPGQPILTMSNYTVTPQQVRPGQEFTVAIEIYNNGSRAGENTLVIFSGGAFLPLGEKSHLLWQLHINAKVSVSQQMRVPATLGNGVHQLEVMLEANDWEGNNYKFPTTIPVEVIGASAVGEVTGKPKIVIEYAETVPPVLIPGEPFSLTVRLANRGNRTAVNVFATAASAEMAIPASGGDTVYADLLKIDGVVTVTLPLVLGALDKGGRQSMPVALAYSDYSGGNYSEEQSVGVDVNTSLVKQPQLLIDAYTTAPDFIAPGDTMTLTMRVANVGGGDAQRITLALGGEGGASLAPFVPLKSGNVIFIEEIPMGGSVEVSRELIVDGSAETRAHSLPIELQYDDPRAARHKETQRLSLIVRERPELQASFYQPPGVLMVGMPNMLSLELLNVGRSSVNIVEIVPQGAQIDVEVQGLPYVGPLDAGGSAPVDLLVTPREGGPAELVLEVAYRDDFNQTQVISRTLPLEIMEAEGPVPGEEGKPIPGEMPEPAPEGPLQKIWRAIKGFLGLGS